MPGFAPAAGTGGPRSPATLVTADGTTAERRVRPAAGSEDPEAAWRPVAERVSEVPRRSRRSRRCPAHLIRPGDLGRQTERFGDVTRSTLDNVVLWGKS